MSSQPLVTLVQDLSDADLEDLAENIIPKLLAERQTASRVNMIKNLTPGATTWISDFDWKDISHLFDQEPLRMTREFIVFEAEFPEWDDLEYFEVTDVAGDDKQFEKVRKLNLDTIDADFIRRHHVDDNFDPSDTVGENSNIEIGRPINDYVYLPIYIIKRVKV